MQSTCAHRVHDLTAAEAFPGLVEVAEAAVYTAAHQCTYTLLHVAGHRRRSAGVFCVRCGARLCIRSVHRYNRNAGGDRVCAKWHVHSHEKFCRDRISRLYLMRNGIKVGNISILPKIEQLHLFLPPENMLKTHFGVRSKYITDSENRAKHCLRQATEEQLRNAGFKTL